MITLLALILRLALLAVFTFGFVVLYEHGPAHFAASAKTEWSALRAFAVSPKSSDPVPQSTPEPPPAAPEPTPETTPPPAPEPTPTPAPSVAPTPTSSIGAWDALQKRPIGEGMDIPVADGAGVPPPTNGTNP
ncbi:MAG: hypothetical protein ACOYMS_11275 [Terrimicrobiaceae bacterium]